MCSYNSSEFQDQVRLKLCITSRHTPDVNPQCSWDGEWKTHSNLQSGLIPKLAAGLIPKLAARHTPRLAAGLIPRLAAGLIPRLAAGLIPRLAAGLIPRLYTVTMKR